MFKGRVRLLLLTLQVLVQPDWWFTCETRHAGADVSRPDLLTGSLVLTGVEEALVENLQNQITVSPHKETNLKHTFFYR